MSETAENPVSTQPQSQPLLPSQWVPPPEAAVDCPPGLEYLASIDQLLVHQKLNSSKHSLNSRLITSTPLRTVWVKKVYIAVEDNDCCTRNCCGPIRPFTMKIYDNKKTEVLRLNRPFRCDSCCCPCFLQRMEVTNSGNVIGYVVQEWSICKPKFRIENAAGDCVLRIVGPFCTFSLCGDVEFQLLTSDESKQVGKITKQWSGLAREIFTDADHFGITFPLETDVNVKGTLIGACFLIDYMFFEKMGRQERDTPGMV